jgi:hypothetical protein
MNAATRIVLLLAVVLLLSGPGPVRAEEEETREPLLTRMFHVGALTCGRTFFIGVRAPTELPHMVSDEMNPLFGAEGEEPILQYGTVDELIELIRNAVAPWYWEETEGADIRASGEEQLIAKAEATVQDSIGAFLANLEEMAGALVTVDVHAVQLSLAEAAALASGPDGALDPDKVEALISGDDAGPSLSLTAYSGMRVSGYAGHRRAWVSDADVEVAQESQIADPIVSVANLGLALDVRPVATPDRKQVLVGLDVALSGLAVDRSASTGASGEIELPGFDVTVVRAAVGMEAGAWMFADGAGHEGGDSRWRFLLRATVHGEPRGPGGVDLPKQPARALGPMGIRYFPIPVLATAVRNIPGGAPIPMPSSYTPPEPPELPEPWPFIPEEAVVDMIRELGGEEFWEDPATIEVRNRTIIARNTPAMLAGIDRLLETLRKDLFWTIDTTVEVIEAPMGVARHLGVGGALGEEQAGILAEALASGQAVRLDTAVVTSLAGARNTVTSGRLVRYVQDYEPEIAQDARILNPIILHFFDGLEADVRPMPTLDRKAAQVSLRILRAHQDGDLRKFSVSPGAEVELPDVETFELNTEICAPMGRTSIAAVWGSGGRARLLLVTPSFR